MRQVRFGFLFSVLVSITFITGCKQKRSIVIPVPVEVATAEDINPVIDSLVIPYQYFGKLTLNSLSVIERKNKFIAMLLPCILMAKFELNQDYQKFESIIETDSLSWSDDEKSFIESIYIKYKTQDRFEVTSCLATHPTSIVLAQAAIESAWGTSRFFTKAMNPFGIWSFSKNEPRIASLSARNEKFIYLRKYSNLEEAIDDYFRIIATGPYSNLRKARLKTDDPFEIINGLLNYSEKKETYVEEIAKIIKKNNLRKYDHYTINPDYIK